MIHLTESFWLDDLRVRYALNACYFDVMSEYLQEYNWMLSFETINLCKKLYFYLQYIYIH